jgi:hypothetical protein
MLFSVTSVSLWLKWKYFLRFPLVNSERLCHNETANLFRDGLWVEKLGTAPGWFRIEENMKRRIILGIVGVLIGFLIYLVIYFLTLQPINTVLGGVIPLLIGIVFFLAGGKPSPKPVDPSAAQSNKRPSYGTFLFFLVVILLGGAFMYAVLGGGLQLLTNLR